MLSYGIKYERGGSKLITGFSGSSHNIDPDDGRSTTGHVFYYGRAPVTWCSQKQNTVALSSCEAEFMAATAAACQAIWLRHLLREVTRRKPQKIVLHVDNTSAIALIENPIFHGRSKHIHTQYHYIRESVENDQVEVKHVSGNEQRADILTKLLARMKFKEMQELVGVEEFSNFKSEIRG